MTPRLWTLTELRARTSSVLATWDAEVDRAAIRTFARAVGYHDALYFDVDHARALGYDDLPLPPGMTPLQRFAPGDPQYPTPISVEGTTKRLNAGTEIELFAEAYPGDYRGSHHLIDVYEREGNLGHMIFTVSEYRYETPGGVHVLTKRHTSICY